MVRRASVLLASVGLLAGVLALLPSSAGAGGDLPPLVLQVDTPADVVDGGDGLTSLREAFTQANAAAEIVYLQAFGVTGGYADGTFRPNGSVTRQAMAAFLYRLSDIDEHVVGPQQFSDVPWARRTRSSRRSSGCRRSA